MPLVLPSAAPHAREQIELGSEGSFTIVVQKPSWGDLLADGELATDYLDRRIRATVAGWEGIHDAAGQEIPFSHPMLARVCVAYPQALRQILMIVGRMYSGDSSKNSETPPSATSSDAAT